MTASASANRNHRNQRNNPYVTDGLAVRLHRSGWGVAWRWRTEIIILTASSAAVVLAAFIAILLIVPVTRRYAARRFWCVLVRHRIQRLCYEARLHTRSGRLPLILWTRPTKVGERTWLLCRAGICAEDFEHHIGELRAACFARDARVTRDVRWSHLVTIDIIRRDTLAPSHIVPSPLTTNRRTLPADGSGEAA